MLQVGSKVKLLPISVAKQKSSAITILDHMVPNFGKVVTVTHIGGTGAFTIAEGSAWYSPLWIDHSEEYVDKHIQHVDTTSYFNQHSNFLGETFCIKGITFFRDSNNVVHMLPQQLV